MATEDEQIRREDLHGTWMMDQAQALGEDTLTQERREIMLTHGLEAAESIRDRKLSLFNRVGFGFNHFAPFLTSRYLEDMRQLGGQDVAFVGVPYDGGTVFRPGTRMGPQAMRRISALQRGYMMELGVDLNRSLGMVDVGDVNVIPGNLEESFDQIAKAMAYIAEREIFPVVLGGDHSIGYPDVRGLSPFIDGNIGIVHIDRHTDLMESGLDERMHGSPFFHATNIPNAPPTNLVQIGVGGASAGREGITNARDRGTTVISVRDLERYGLDRIVEYALEIAWKNAKAVWISFDIDAVDPAFAPGTGTPAPGGLLPREVLSIIREVAAEGAVGMEIVEVAPPYDVSDITSLLGVYAILECLGSLVQAGKLGCRPQPSEGEAKWSAMPLESQTLPGTLRSAPDGAVLAQGWCLITYELAGRREPLSEWSGEMICDNAEARAALSNRGDKLYLHLDPYGGVQDPWHGPVRATLVPSELDPNGRRVALRAAGSLIRSPGS